CCSCIIQSHQSLPLHFLEHWNRGFFKRCTLMDLGFIIQLGHHSGNCPSIPTEKQNDPISRITVVNVTGVQDVHVQYCRCAPAHSFTPKAQPLQFLSAQMWPSTYLRTCTVFTLQALQFFQQLTLQSKVSAYDYLGTLRHLTNNPCGNDVKDCYQEFMRASHHYQYLCLLKWNGLSVSRNIPSGSLAVLCPACPQPGINMDPTWRERPLDKRYLDALHYGKDGNFSLNQHDKKMDELDVALTEGAAYYADIKKHEECKRR
ncbi:hypothetical protein BC835DRAFT_1235178, partial [Cytidiella melzeri]